MLGNRSGERTGPGLGRSRPPPPSRPVTARKEDGRPRPELRKRCEGGSQDFLLGEAGSPGGRSPGRHTHPGGSPRLPGRSCPGPAASRALPARLMGRSRERRWVPPATPRLSAPTRVPSPGGTPGRAGRLFPARCGHPR